MGARKKQWKIAGEDKTIKKKEQTILSEVFTTCRRCLMRTVWPFFSQFDRFRLSMASM